MPARLLQTLLNQEFDLKLVVDGDIGPKTFAGLDSLAPVDYDWLEFLLSVQGVDMAKALIRDRGFKIPSYTHLKVQDCNNLVLKACKLIGISPSLAPIFQDFLRMEAASRNVNGAPCYYVLSRSDADARGLMQMQSGAWIDARKKALLVGESLDIGEYRENVYFPANNIVGALAYSLIGIDLMKAQGIPVNRETLYLCHNQGPYIWSRDKKGNLRGPTAKNVVGQSAEAKSLIAKYFS